MVIFRGLFPFFFKYIKIYFWVRQWRTWLSPAFNDKCSLIIHCDLFPINFDSLPASRIALPFTEEPSNKKWQKEIGSSVTFWSNLPPIRTRREKSPLPSAIFVSATRAEAFHRRNRKSFFTIEMRIFFMCRCCCYRWNYSLHHFFVYFLCHFVSQIGGYFAWMKGMERGDGKMSWFPLKYAPTGNSLSFSSRISITTNTHTHKTKQQ